jgi:hypothetical protein
MGKRNSRSKRAMRPPLNIDGSLRALLPRTMLRTRGRLHNITSTDVHLVLTSSGLFPRTFSWSHSHCWPSLPFTSLGTNSGSGRLGGLRGSACSTLNRHQPNVLRGFKHEPASPPNPIGQCMQSLYPSKYLVNITIKGQGRVLQDTE